LSFRNENGTKPLREKLGREKTGATKAFDPRRGLTPQRILKELVMKEERDVVGIIDWKNREGSTVEKKKKKKKKIVGIYRAPRMFLGPGRKSA